MEDMAGMGKLIIRILAAIGVSVFASSLFVVDKIPQIQSFTALGREIVNGAGIYTGDGQGGEEIVAEFLGGQMYWNGISESEQHKRILEENSGSSSVVYGQEDGALPGDVDMSGQKALEENSVAVGSRAIRRSNTALEKLRSTLDTEYLWNHFYIVDSTTSVKKSLFPVKELLERNMTMKKKSGKKQILIYHTHGASEYFSDSKNGKIEDSVVGVGDELTKELEKLGYGVIHDKTHYDLINGSLDRSLAYNKALDGIKKILAANPDVKVIIDLHRDSVGKGKHTYTTINGKKSAIVMFFNGLSRTRSGPITYLENPNLQGNLAFSLQLKCKAMEYYDGFTKPIYLKGYRYNLHLQERSLLIELGNENNTVEEAKNAAAPLADVLHKVLSGQG